MSRCLHVSVRALVVLPLLVAGVLLTPRHLLAACAGNPDAGTMNDLQRTCSNMGAEAGATNCFLDSECVCTCIVSPIGPTGNGEMLGSDCLSSPSACYQQDTTSQWCKLSCFAMTQAECDAQDMYWMDADHEAGQECCTYDARVVSCATSTSPPDCNSNSEFQIFPTEGLCCTFRTQAEAEVWMQDHDPENLEGYECTFGCQSFRPGIKFRAPLDDELSTAMTCGSGERVNHARGELMLDEVDFSTPGTHPNLPITMSRSYRSGGVVVPYYTPADFSYYAGSHAFGDGWYFPFEMQVAMTGSGILILKDGMGQLREFALSESCHYAGHGNATCTWKDGWSHDGSADTFDVIDRANCEFRLTLRDGSAFDFEATVCELDGDPNASTLDHEYPLSAYRGRLKQVVDTHGTELVLHYRAPLPATITEVDPCATCALYDHPTESQCTYWQFVNTACPECNAASCDDPPSGGTLALYCDDWLASSTACPDCPLACGPCSECAAGGPSPGDTADNLLDRVTDEAGTVLLSFTWERLPDLFFGCPSRVSCWHDRVVQACRRDGACWTYDYYDRPQVGLWHEQEFEDLPADQGGLPGMLRSVTTPPVAGAELDDANAFPEGLTRTYTYHFDPAEPDWGSGALATVTDGRGHVVLKNEYYFYDVPINGSPWTSDGDWSNFGCGDLPAILPGRLAKQVHGDPGEVEPRLTHYYYAPIALSGNPPDFWVPGVPALAPVLKSIVNDHGRVTEYGVDANGRDVQTRVFTGLADPASVTTVLANRPKTFEPALRATDPEYYQTTVGNDPRGIRGYTRHPNGRETITWPVHMDRVPDRSKLEIRAVIEVAGPVESDQAFLTTLYHYDFDDQYNDFTYNVINKETRYTSNPNQHFNPASWFFDPPDGSRSVLQTLRTHVRDFVTSEMVVECDDRWMPCAHVRYLRDIDVVPDSLGRVWSRTGSPFPTAGSSAARRRDELVYRDTAPGAGLLETVIENVDNDAAATTLEYDDVGRVRRELDALGGDRLITYNTLGWKVREESPLIDNDGAGPLDAFRQRTDYFHDENGNVVRIEVENRDERGGLRENASLTTEITFDALNRPVRTVQEVDENRRITTEKDYYTVGQVKEERTGECVAGRDDYARTRFQYDERGLLYRKSEGVGTTSPTPQPSLVTQHDYDLNGNLARTTVGVGLAQPRVTEWRYDAYDRMVEETGPTGTRRVLHYDGNGAVVSETVHGSDGAATPTEVLLQDITYVRDGLGRAIETSAKAIDPDTRDPIAGGTITTKANYSHEHPTSSSDGYGTGPSFLYDTAGRLAKTTSQFGSTIESEHDLLGRVIKETRREVSQVDQRVEVFEVEHGYDGLGRKKWTEDDLGNITRFVHDSLGNEVAVTDALGGGIATEYDGLGRVTATVRLARADRPQDTSIRTTQEWDDNSRVAAQADDNGNRTEYAYYPLGHLRWTTFADDTQRETQRNAFGDLIEIVEPDNTHVASLFDRAGRVTYVAVGVGGMTDPHTSEETYRYDGLGRLVFAEDDDTVVERVHDSFSHVIKEVVNGLEVSTTYDVGGLPIVRKYPSGLLIHAEPDTYSGTSVPIARVGKLKNDDGTLIADFDYFGASRVELVTFGNEVEGRRYFDTLGRLNRIRYTSWETPLLDLGFGWDALANRTSESNHVTGYVHAWTMDSFSRLVSSSFGQPGGDQKTRSYELDGVQNRTSIHHGTSGYAYWMESAPEPAGPADYQVNQYTSAAGEYFEHDLKGNLAVRESPTGPDYGLTFDHRNRLVEYEDLPMPGKRTRHVIDALGRRVGTRHLDADGSTVWSVAFALDGARVIEEHDSEGGIASHVHGLGLDELLQTRRGSTTFWALTDDLRSVRALADDSGVLLERYEYADYGEPTVHDAAGGVIANSAHENTLLFTGRPYDWTLRAYDLRSRWMDPRLGRFVSRDPLGVWGDAIQVGNPYAYAGSNPRRFVDPMGTATWELGGPLVQLTVGRRTPVVFAKTILTDALVLSRRLTPMAVVDDIQNAPAMLHHASEMIETAKWVARDPDGAQMAAEKALGQHLRQAMTDDGEIAGEHLAHLMEAGAMAGAGAPAAMRSLSSAASRLGGFLRNLGKAVRSTTSDTIRAGARVTAPTSEVVASEQAIPGGARAANRVCFAAGTLIRTDVGARPIETLDIGDRVWSQDEETGQSGWKPVLRKFRNPDQPLVELVLIDAFGKREVLRLTSAHPLRHGDQWIAAGELSPGADVTVLAGAMRLLSRRDAGRAAVYNVEVAHWHTYFVGQVGVWAHNGDCFDLVREVNALPGDARLTTNVDAVYRHIKEHNGIDRHVAKDRLHEIKESHELGPADNVIFDWSGGVFNARSGERLGSLTYGGAKRGR